MRSTVFNFALISLSAFLFVFTEFGFDFRLFAVLVFLSAFFVSLTLFTGRQSARTLLLELQYAKEALTNNRDDAANAPAAQSGREGLSTRSNPSLKPSRHRKILPVCERSIRF